MSRWLVLSILHERTLTHTHSTAEHTALHAIKPYDQRRDTTKWLESDADEQLIIKIPFTGSIKLKVRHACSLS